MTFHQQETFTGIDHLINRTKKKVPEGNFGVWRLEYKMNFTINGNNFQDCIRITGEYQIYQNDQGALVDLPEETRKSMMAVYGKKMEK